MELQTKAHPQLELHLGNLQLHILKILSSCIQKSITTQAFWMDLGLQMCKQNQGFLLASHDGQTKC
jgi:hypothetical protein